MQAEREELVKRALPQLRERCKSRGVTRGEVGLRWGVTNSQKAEGQVLSICLVEIQHCRPYFLGLLGKRYGWVPNEISPELIEREPWLAEQCQPSATELEILHGALNKPQMAGTRSSIFSARHISTRSPLCSGRFFEIFEKAQGPEHPETIATLLAMVRLI